MLAAGEPFADQRGFPKTGGSRDQGEFTSKILGLVQALVQFLDQAGTKNGLESEVKGYIVLS